MLNERPTGWFSQTRVKAFNIWIFPGPRQYDRFDLLGRDFTINAMAVNVNDPQKLIDPLGGAQDLRDKIIRHVV